MEFADVISQIRPVWISWRQIIEVFDKKGLAVKLKWKFCRTVMWPVVVCRSDWTIKKNQEQTVQDPALWWIISGR